MLKEAVFARRFVYHLKHFSNIVLRRNFVGELRATKGEQSYPVGFGKGSSDYIGYRVVEITPEMVGKHIAQFVAVELKSEKGRLRPEQKVFLETLRGHGAIATVARPGDFLKILGVIQSGENVDDLGVKGPQSKGDGLTGSKRVRRKA